MTNEINPEKVVQLLTQSARQLDSGTLSALSNAREKALQRQTVRAPVFTLVTGRWAHMLLPFTNHQWVSAGLLLAALLVVGTSYLHHAQEQQIAELDVAILTDDLPIEVFVD